MKKLLIAIAGAVLVLGACGDDSANEPLPYDNTPRETTAGEDAAPEDVFSDKCLSCHGDGVETFSDLTYEEVLQTIEVPHKGVDVSEQAESLSEWIAAQ